MFIDTSAVVAILSGEEDAAELSDRIDAAPVRITSALVVLEAVMRLSSKLEAEPLDVEISIGNFLREAEVDVVPIEHRDGTLAIRAFADFGKGRGHPAQLNLADCLSYACAKNRNVPILYKGHDFAHTDFGQGIMP